MPDDGKWRWWWRSRNGQVKERNQRKAPTRITTTMGQESYFFSAIHSNKRCRMKGWMRDRESEWVNEGWMEKRWRRWRVKKLYGMRDKEHFLWPFQIVGTGSFFSFSFSRQISLFILWWNSVYNRHSFPSILRISCLIQSRENLPLSLSLCKSVAQRSRQ